MSDEEAKEALERTVERIKKASLIVPPYEPPYHFTSLEECVEWYKNRQKPFGWYERHKNEVADLNKRFQIHIAKKHI